MIDLRTEASHDMRARTPRGATSGRGADVPSESAAFREGFVGLVERHFHRLFRYLDRVTGDPELAQDLAQEAFLRLYQRGAVPDAPGAWLVTVARNLLRNEKSRQARRGRLITAERAKHAHSDPGPPPSSPLEVDRVRVRTAVDSLPQRDRDLLLLRAEGYRYRELAEALDIAEGSVGTLLARAKRRFLEAYREGSDAR